jgi:hypothetical protein
MEQIHHDSYYFKFLYNLCPVFRVMFYFGILYLLSQDMLMHTFYRAVNVFSCAYLVNMSRSEHRHIPLKHQKALWFSGEFHF